MEQEKFNYQVIFKESEDSRIIFAGTTTESISNLLESFTDFTNLNYSFIENVVYQPVKPIEDGSKK